MLLMCGFFYYSQIKQSVALKFEYEYDALAIVDVVDQEVYDQTDSGGDSEKWSYNVWEGVRDLWNEQAYLLCIIIAVWSGLWPYLKWFILGIALIVYRNVKLPDGYEWLSTIGHYSFIDAWFVLLVAVAIRFELDASDTEQQSQLDGLVEIETTVDLLLWIQGYALDGVYIFVAAISASQIMGFIFIRLGQTNPQKETNEIPRWDPHSRKSVCLGMESTRSLATKLAMPPWEHTIFVLFVFFVIAGVFVFEFIALNIDIFKVTFEFDLEVAVKVEETFKVPLPFPIPDIEAPVNYDETFAFTRLVEKSYSLVEALEELKMTTGDVGSSNLGMYYIGIILIFYLTLIRIGLAALAWIIPMPIAFHRIA